MTKISFATNPYLLGFDRLDRLVERSAKNSDGYPPYNIEILAENTYRITLALAGFEKDDVEITLEANHLTIQGKQSEPSDERVFLHRGIAARGFKRSFVLADGVEVGSAEMENGLLHIDLEREMPERISKTIPINTR